MSQGPARVRLLKVVTPPAALPKESVECVERAPQGRPDISRLYQEQSPIIRKLLGRLLGPHREIEDLMQEVFVVALKRLPALEQSDCAPRLWLTGIAVRLAANARRKLWFKKVLLGDGAEANRELVEWHTPEWALQGLEEAKRLYALLGTLSEKQREVVILFELHGMSCAEISQALACPLKTVYWRLDQAREKLIRRNEATLRRWTTT